MGKKGKKAVAGKPKKLTPKDIGKRLDALARKLEEELKKGADLFAPPPPTDDCALCLMPLSRIGSKSRYKTCCGNTICVGCAGESAAFNDKNKAKRTPHCPFCREPEPSSAEEAMRRLEARALKNDHDALCSLGRTYDYGENGCPKDALKALDYYIRAAELGSADGCSAVAESYDNGEGISVDKRRAAFFYRVGALRGSIGARHNLGFFEYNAGNHELGIRHWKIAAEAGMQPSLNNLRKIYNSDGKRPGKEFINKGELDSIYRVCHDAQEEVKSEEREKHQAEEDGMKC